MWFIALWGCEPDQKDAGDTALVDVVVDDTAEVPDTAPDTAPQHDTHDTGCEPGSWYADVDGDGFGDPEAPTEACEQPTGTVTDANDCDDTSAQAFPGAEEVCDGRQNDCSSTWEGDEGLVTWTAADGTREDWSAAWVTAGTTALEGAGELAICPGSYERTLEVWADEVTVRGVGGRELVELRAVDENAVVGWFDDTLVEGLTLTGGSHVVQAGAATTWTLRDLAVRDGTDTEGGSAGCGLWIQDTAEVVLEQVEVRDSHCASQGGGIAVGTNARLEATDLTVSGSSAYYGGGLAVQGGGAATIDGATFEDNTAEAGAGIFVELGGSLVLDDATIADNVADLEGGGLWVMLNGSVDGVQVGEVSFTDNRAVDGSGGATKFYLYQGYASFRGTSFTGNVAGDGGGALAATAMGASLSLTDVTASGNEADQGGFASLSGSVVALTDSLLEANLARQGSAVYLSSDAELQCSSADSKASHGMLRHTAIGESPMGAVHIDSGTLTNSACDYGEPDTPDDNEHFDVLLTSSEGFELGTDATVDCDSNGCG